MPQIIKQTIMIMRHLMPQIITIINFYLNGPNIIGSAATIHSLLAPTSKASQRPSFDNHLVEITYLEELGYKFRGNGIQSDLNRRRDMQVPI